MKQRIKNRRDWWLVSVCEQNEVVGTDKRNPRRRPATWVNTLLIKAPSLGAAYDKALRVSRVGNNRYRAVSGKTAYWKVVGVWDLVPIYEDIEDGAELIWQDCSGMSVAQAQRHLVTKAKLKQWHRQWLAQTVKRKRKRTSA